MVRPNHQALKETAEIIHALNSKKRWAILGALFKEGELSRVKLGELLELSEGSLNYHLGVLRKAGLIESFNFRKEGTVIYRISEKGKIIIGMLLKTLRGDL